MRPRPELLRLALLLAFLVPVFGASSLTIAFFTLDRPLPVSALLQEFVAWIAAGLCVPPLILWLDRFARTRKPRIVAIALHVATFIVLLAVHTLLYELLLWLVSIETKRPSHISAMAFARYDALLYPLLVAAVFLVNQRRRTRRSELAAARLQRRVAEAEMEHVRVSLDPDEVIAELTAVETRIVSDPDGAEERLHEISRSLRQKLGRIAAGSRRLPRRARPYAAPCDLRRDIVLFSAVYGVYFASIMTALRLMGGGRTWTDLVGTFAAFLFAGVSAAAAIPWFRRALSWRASSRARKWIGIAFVAVFCAAQGALIELVMLVLRPTGFGRPFASTFDYVFMLTVVAFYIVAYDDLKVLQRESRLQAERLATAVAEARLRSLRTQIAPHFVFNALNSVLSLIRHDAAAARQMLQRLRILLQATTAHRNRQELLLREDLEMTRSYLDIERVRFRDAIDVTMDVDEKLLDVPVPAFLLQPLVENAIRHGALASIGRGSVGVSVRGEERSLAITIRNDGELLDPSGWKEGIGLSNIRARLAQLYGERHELAIAVHETTGVSVTVRLPRS